MRGRFNRAKGREWRFKREEEGMLNAVNRIEKPTNEPVFSYAPNTAEREKLKTHIEKMLREEIEIPLMIGGKEVRTGRVGECRCPHDHGHLLGRFHQAGPNEVAQAVEEAKKAWNDWSEMDWVSRASIFLRAAELISTKYRFILNAATMLGQSKTVHQAEIDSACELADFYRFNPYYMSQIYSWQPESPSDAWNRMDFRPLEGFIFAVSPFNFTAIAGNLPTAPAMMGNTVVLKPASTAVYSAYYLTQLWREAGLPDGVINFLPGPGGQVGNYLLKDQNLAGIHFTGSTPTFYEMWRTIGLNIEHYRSYPRIVGETGGKDFVFVHASADIEVTATALIRGAFEYQGQKCSAASRAYIPSNLWPALKSKLIEEISTIRVGDITDFSNFMGAVIDQGSFSKIAGYIEYAKHSGETEILYGGGCDSSRGYFIEPTLILTQNPNNKLMIEEIFGPVLTVYVYPETNFEETLELCNHTSPYALTGSILANDRKAINLAMKRLRHAAGNFYINDKPTGAVVAQQPFGGGRLSGTNDKAGSILNLIRWTSPRALKENLCPPRNYRYPFMGPEG